MKLSVIVPVYNVEKYLRKCLDSLVNQTFHDMEIIIVNDGSPDKSQEIIEEYDKKYPFVKAFVKENGGLSDARNYGIARAQGEYLAFVDSDDYVEPTMYETMYTKAVSGNFDMVVCDFEEIYSDHTVNGTSRLEDDLKNAEEVKKHMKDIYPSAWNKIYRRNLFEKIQFKKNVWFEDVELMYRMLPYIRSIGVVQQAFYKYVQREGSISKSNDERIYHCVDNWNGIVEFYKENQLYESFYKELEYNYVRYLYATFIKAALKFEYVHFQKAVETAIENVKREFPGYHRNNYFYASPKGIYLLVFNKWIAKFYYKLKQKK